ncbi:acyltransferase [Pseudomarimonas salicorniae]|uniref:Acyltransferase n=1 Tax=Pseudomarimonas salicorniae TaxID=2933270 RepID=A0ABT0GDX8_9GAMM|nr:acyltransferase [Lysobacter sp. CAU 1642]MCK7592364.1 acyltransferase [Lysobacter sp. CAU 1642]
MSWKQRPEGGGRFALWLIRSIALYGGRPLGRLLLYPITLYFLLRRRPERHASRAYLSRVFGRPARLSEVARHIHTFACTILDRVFLLSGRFGRFEVEVHGLEVLHQAMEQGRGVLLLGSHHGSFESLRALSQTRPEVDVRVVLDKGQNPEITQLLDALNPQLARGVIDASQPGTSIVLAIGEAAAEGALIGLLADRARPGEPSMDCEFLGSPAPFPTAPMLIASSLHIPVVLCFGLYRGGRRYDLHFELFSEGLRIPRAGRAAMLSSLLQRYAQRLEHHVRLAPYNWFNFYDFWQTDARNAGSPAVPAEPVARAGG